MDRSQSTSHAVLRDEILADAERQAKRILRRAERDAREMLDKANAEAEQERSEKQAAARAQVERIEALIFATVPVEIGRMRAAREERELDRLREAVRRRLRERRGFDYPPTLVALASEALDRMQGDEFLLGLAERDQPLADELIAAVRNRCTPRRLRLKVAPEAADITGGVIVRDVSGRQEWDNSLDARLDRIWPLLRHQLAQQLGLQEDEELAGGQS